MVQLNVLVVTVLLLLLLLDDLLCEVHNLPENHFSKNPIEDHRMHDSKHPLLHSLKTNSSFIFKFKFQLTQFEFRTLLLFC